MSGPLCRAVLRDGSPCRSVATVGDLCAGCDRLGRTPAPPLDVSAGVLSALDSHLAEDAPTEAPEEETPTVRPAAALSGSEAREAVRGAVGADELRGFFEEAMAAKKLTLAICPECGSKKVPVSVTDWAARVQALKLLKEWGFEPPRKPEPDEDEPLAAQLVAQLLRTQDGRARLRGRLLSRAKEPLRSDYLESFDPPGDTPEPVRTVAAVGGYMLVPPTPFDVP